MNFSVYQASHIGDRRYNQDRAAYAYSNEALLLVLADGMGGHLHGEWAANLTIETFTESFGRHAQPRIADPDQFISSTMRHAHERIMKFPHDMDMGGFPGTTCVAALVQDGKLYWGHAGDSRLYLLRDGAVMARTRDHSIVQQWFEQGAISAEQARNHPQRNQITNCLGSIGDAFRWSAANLSRCNPAMSCFWQRWPVGAVQRSGTCRVFHRKPGVGCAGRVDRARTEARDRAFR